MQATGVYGMQVVSQNSQKHVEHTSFFHPVLTQNRLLTSNFSSWGWDLDGDAFPEDLAK